MRQLFTPPTFAGKDKTPRDRLLVIRRFLGRLPFRVVLAVPLASLLVIAIGLTGYLAFQNGQRAVNDLANQLHQQAAARLHEHLDSYLATPLFINQLNLDAIRLGQLDVNDQPAMERHFLTQIQRFDSVISLAYASQQREYVGTYRKVLGVDLGVAVASKENGYALEAYSVTPQGGRQLLDSALDYDPRSRPWYQAAVQAGHPTWTPVFMWSSGDLGLDAVVPVYGADDSLLGVLDTSLTLNAIGDFLDGLRVSENGETFIVEKSGMLVASSTLKTPFIRNGNEVQQLSALESGDPLVQIATQSLEQQFGALANISRERAFDFDISGKRQFAEVTPYAGDHGLDWLIVTVIPESDVMAPINAGNRQTVLLISLSLLASITLAALLSIRITRPIMQLNQSAKALAQGDWTQKVAVNREDEIGELSASFNRMAEQLQLSFASLRASEEHSRTLAAAAFEGIAITENGIVLDANDQLAMMLGCDRGELIGQPVMNFVAPESRERVMAAIRSGSQEPYEHLALRKDGTAFPVDIRGRPMEIGGRQLRVTAILDITERKRAEQEIAEWQQRYELVAAASGQIVYERNFANGIVCWGGSVEKVLGYQQSEMDGGWSWWEELIDPRDRAPTLRLLDVTEKNGSPLEVEYGVRHKDGHYVQMLDRGFVVPNPTGKPERMIGILQDITVRKQAEEELRKLSRAVEQSPVSIVITDPDGRIEYVNPKFVEITGYAVAEAIGQNPRILKSGYTPTEEYTRLWDAIKSGGEWRGEFCNKKKNGNPYWETAAISALSDSSGTITHFVAVKEDITERKQRERELEAIATVSTALRTARTRAEMVPIILEQVMDLLQAQGAILDIYDPASHEIVTELGLGQWVASTGLHIPSGEGVSGQVIASSQSYVNNDARADPAFYRPDLLGEIRAVAAVPLAVQKQTLGTLIVGRGDGQPAIGFSESEVRVLTSIANIAANAIHRSTLHEQTERRAQQLAALHDIDTTISSSFDLNATLNVLLGHVTTQLQVHAALVWLLNPHTQTLEYAAGRGFRGNAMTRLTLQMGESQAGRAALERRLISLPNVAEAEELLAHPELLASEDIRAVFSAPLVAKGHLVGVLEVFHRTPLAPDLEWLGFLTSLAGQATIAIENASLIDNLQLSNTELILAYDATIEGWSRALDLRDKETEGHTQRVTKLTLQLARAMGLSDAELVHIRRGALLHDIGKMGVPDSILLKPDPLTADEQEVMRKHPQSAYEMLAPITYLKPALEIPYCHHEKWDGTGYPRGLKGEAIPLAARLFAVVDVWDALRSDRPYRTSWPEEKVREHIKALSGTHFDPQAVEVFLRVARQE